MVIGELEDGNLIEIEDDNEVDFLEVNLEEGVMGKTKKIQKSSRCRRISE